MDKYENLCILTLKREESNLFVNRCNIEYFVISGGINNTYNAVGARLSPPLILNCEKLHFRSDIYNSFLDFMI